MEQTIDANWIKQFIAKNGRPPRILHVGNIANNAYQTAKMLIAAGADCDVLCADYYHAMGNPEWDDADFDGDIGSQQCPAWHRVDLHGFKRPNWFAQGPRHLAIAYLLARRSTKFSDADKLWGAMERARAKLAEQAMASADGSLPAPDEGPFAKLKKAVGNGKAALYSLLDRDVKAKEAYRWSPAISQKVRRRLAKHAQKYFPGRKMSFGPDADYYIRTAYEYKSLFARYDIIQAYALEPVWPYLLGLKNYVAYEHGTLRDMPYEDTDLARLTLLAYAAAGAVYVTNVDCCESAEAITAHSGAPIVWGLHGFDTERALQKQQRAAAGTPLARESFATPGQRLFFCPARVDIDAHYGTYLKANDMLYRALAKAWDERPGSFKVLQLAWGRDVDALKQFIHSECPQLEEAVLWHAPFKKGEFYSILQFTDLVFDNFLLRLMGGNGIETLMSGTAALVNKRIPEETMLRFFPEMWPVLAVETEEDLAAAVIKAVDAPEACRALAQKGQRWILRYHSHAAIVARNLQAYNKIIPLTETSG